MHRFSNITTLSTDITFKMTHPLTKLHHYITRISTIILATALLALSYGCNSRADALLERANSLMREHPDSALTIIESIDPDRLSDDEDKAFYALLMTEARYYTGPDQTEDSLINIAASYYHLRDNNPLRARAYYQKGMIHANAGQYSSAFLALMLAEETASALNDTKLLALIHRSIADTYCFIENPKTAVNYYTQSYEEFMAVNDTVYAYDGLYDIARANYNATNYQTALDTLQVLLPKTEAFREQASIPYILDLLAKSYMEVGKYSEAVSAYTRLHNEYPTNMNPSTWNNLGLAYLNLRDIAKARECEDSIKRITNEPSWLSYKIATTTNDYPTALRLLQGEYKDTDKFFLEWVSRSAEKDLLDQYASLKKTTRQEKKTNTIILTLTVIIVILLVIIGYLVISNLCAKNRRLTDDNERLTENNVSLSEQKGILSKQVEDNNTTIRRLKEKIDIQDNEIVFLRATLITLDEEKKNLTKEIRIKTDQNNLLKANLAEADKLLANKEKAIVTAQGKLKEAVSAQSELIDTLIKAYYSADTKKLPKNVVLDKFKEIVHGLHHDEKIIRRFEESVNRNLDNLITNFKTDYPNLNDYEYDLFLLSVLGFSSKSICVFQETAIENFYNRKSKLIKKLKKISEVNSIKYLDFL